MAQDKLTAAKVRTLKPGPDGAAKYYADGGGLFVIVRGKPGHVSRSYGFRGTLNGRQLPMMHLSPIAKMSLADARAGAEPLFSRDRCNRLIREGKDPRQVRIDRRAMQEKSDDDGARTVNRLLDLYFKRKVEPKRQFDTEDVRLARIKKAMGLLDRVRNAIGKISVAEVSAEMLADVKEGTELGLNLNTLFTTNPPTALELRRILRKMFKMAISLKWTADNPADDLLDDLLTTEYHVSTPHPALDYVDAPRFIAELKAYKNPGRGMADRPLDTVPAMLFLVYSGVRIEEVVMAQWREIHWDSLLWLVPAGHRKKRKGGDEKKHKDRAITISKPMLAVLEEMKRRCPDAKRDDLIFPGRGKNGGLRRGSTLQCAQKIVKLFKPETHITQHGFRAMYQAWHRAQVAAGRCYPPINVERQFDHTAPGIDFENPAFGVAGYGDHNRPNMTDPTIEGELGRRAEMEHYGEYLTSYEEPPKFPAAIIAQPAQLKSLP